MNCIAFPKMFKTNSTIVKKDKEASSECLYLLLSSEKGTLVMDTFYGIRLKRYTFNQNNYVLADLITDEILTETEVFCPQLTITRDDITITQNEKGKLVAKIKALNKSDYTTNMYELVLLTSEEEV